MGEIENADGTGTVGNASCGDIMQITLKIENTILYKHSGKIWLQTVLL